MNEPLSSLAKDALSGPRFESQPHFCQRWVRQVVQAVYGSKFDEFWSTSARLTGRRFKKSPYAVNLTNGSVVGDLLYKLNGSGGAGHVGIRIAGNRVAENSSVHWDGIDARGIRTLREFGHFDLIVRLPLPTMLEILSQGVK